MSLMTVASALAQLLQSADCSQDAEERLIEETDGFILSVDVASSIEVPSFSHATLLCVKHHIEVLSFFRIHH